MKIAVTLPTYNEIENITAIIEQILAQDKRIHVLVIDDLSPDGTGHCVDELARSNNRVSILHRTGTRGRGLAGIAGFQHALSSGADLIFEMDADFSHAPAVIPQMIEAAKKYDVVIGSRFCHGGGEQGRSLCRRLISILANFYIQVMLGFPLKTVHQDFDVFRHHCFKNRIFRIPLNRAFYCIGIAVSCTNHS
ncbi:MAG: glycosyltransferase [bacterium]|nr:glycosyltransferase [bacterium]